MLLSILHTPLMGSISILTAAPIPAGEEGYHPFVTYKCAAQVGYTGSLLSLSLTCGVPRTSVVVMFNIDRFTVSGQELMSAN